MNNPSAIFARVGEWELRSTKEPYSHADYEIELVKLHPRFNDVGDEVENNVALLITKLGIISFPHISPVCTPSGKVAINENKCIVTGWGKSRFEDKSKHVLLLKKIELPIYNRDKCERNLKALTELGTVENWKLHETSICAGGEEGVGELLKHE